MPSNHAGKDEAVEGGGAGCVWDEVDEGVGLGDVGDGVEAGAGRACTEPDGRVVAVGSSGGGPWLDGAAASADVACPVNGLAGGWVRY